MRFCRYSRVEIRLAYAAVSMFLLVFVYASVAYAATGTIDATNHYAWDDNGGYVNWNANSGNVTVTDTALTGYIWSAGFGWINLNPSQGGVTNSNGTLGGYAWGANTGWIDFTGVTIDSNGVFHGHTTAQSLFGTMTFDCTYCNVTTTWRSSSTASASLSANNGSPLIYGRQNANPTSAATNIPPTAQPQKSLIPTMPPKITVQPTKGPPQSGGVVQPAHLTPSITMTINASSPVMAGSPLIIKVNIKSGQRSKTISLAYRLYSASSAVVYAATSSIGSSDSPLRTVSIPTGTIPVGNYTIAVSAQYGVQQVVTQTLPIKIMPAAHPVSAVSPACSGLSCWWQNSIRSLLSLWSHIVHLL